MQLRVGIGLICAAFCGGRGLADCTVSADAGAVVRPLDMQDKDSADIMVSMSMMPKMMHIDYSTAQKRPSCDLGPFNVGSLSYELYGDDKDGRQRKGISSNKGDPVAEIIPVTNLLQAIEASKQGKPASVDGYLLATVTKTEFTGWRYYTGMPGQEILKHDMAEALSGSGAPIFRNGADGKISIFVPKN
jgi:hypothetical protein